MPFVPTVGTAVGTVEGCSAVFHVAVVGQGVVATVGDVVAYGVGPGTQKTGVSTTQGVTERTKYSLT